MAPEIKAPVMTAKSPWNSANKITGTESHESALPETKSLKPKCCMGLPISPPATSSPNAIE